MSQQTSLIAQLWAKADRPGVRAFFLSITALGVALLLAIYSGAAAELGNIGLAASSALLALAIAGWVSVTLCRRWRNARRCAGSATGSNTRSAARDGSISARRCW